MDEKYVPIGNYRMKNGMIVLDAPAGSVTTFFAK